MLKFTQTISEVVVTLVLLRIGYGILVMLRFTQTISEVVVTVPGNFRGLSTLFNRQVA
jgi:hypothetical protein